MSFPDTFGDRIKSFEAVETGRRFDARTSPVYARLDGRGFSKFTRGMVRPFDPRMTEAMQKTCAAVVGHTGARIGYTQSDEISLVWSTDDLGDLSEMMFDGKIQKLSSVLASYATAAFTRAVLTSPDEAFRAYAERMPHFDARIFTLPDRTEATNAILWRTKDAERNAVSMVAQAHFSHKALQGVSQSGMRAMLDEKGISFDDFPTAFRFGSFYRRGNVVRPIEETVRMSIREAFRPASGAAVIRSEIVRIENTGMFSNVENRVGVVFDREDPISRA